jgi:ATP-dependent Clp protease ATP-binding subunit ClpC
MKNYQQQDRLSKNARFVINKTKALARLKNLDKINGLYLINALSTKKGSLGEFILHNLLKKDLSLPTVQEIKKSPLNFSVQDVLIKAFKIASISKNPFVGTEHLFHSLIEFMQEEEPIILKKYFKKELPLFAEENFDKNNFDNQTPQFMNEMQAIIENFFSSQQSKTTESTLKKFGSNLNKIAKKEHHILIGREGEMNRMANILGRRNKNNPVLIGEPGVGKTAIVEGLAQKINQGKAPYYLNNKKIISLDLGLMIAGTNFRGEFEARLKQVVQEASTNKEIIIFIDELHTLIGAGNAMGGLDAANLLKPALSRGEIQVIGATTLDEYRKNIEKDPALERRFQTIFVNEPTLQETEKILNGIKKLYEKHHNIKITAKSIKLASKLAKRYFPNKFLPDSAIDLIDESSAKKRTLSTNIQAYEKLNLEKEKLKKIISQKEALVASDQYEKAISLRNKEQKLRKEIEKRKSEAIKAEKNNPTKLTSKDILEMIAELSKIPIQLLTEKNNQIAEKAKKDLEKEVVGQNKAIKEIYQTLLRRSSGISDPNKPLGSFLFIGASGVGKTLTAKILSKSLSPIQKNNLIQINMSEFMEKHSISKFLGAPAGYIGYDEDKSLTEKIRQNPYSVILFDEIEKADRNILNILLQILDEGKITDAKSRSINFKNSIIILTSNIGTSEMNQLSKIGFNDESDTLRKQEKLTKEEIQKELDKNLSRELLNRLDNILIFNYLNKNSLEKIAEKEMLNLSTRLKERGLNFKFDKNVLKLVTQGDNSPQQGARLIKHQIEKKIEPLIAQEIIAGRNKTLKLKVKSSKIAIG